MAELRTCPFCSGEPTIIVRRGKDGWRDRYAVLCDYEHGGCGAESGWYHYESEAIAAWNRRADANSLTEALKRNTTKIEEKANGIYAEYIRHLQEKNKALDEKLASLRNEADVGIKGR